MKRRRPPAHPARLAAFATLALGGVFFAPRPAQAQEPEPGAELTVSVLTFGPGDHPFFKFGHNAILIQDARRRREIVYNYGTFAFESWSLIPNFLKGKLRYWLSEDSFARTQRAYKRENRTIDQQILNLPPTARLELFRALEKQASTEDRYYKYDYYQDNCSTRVRDRVDEFTNGAVKKASGDPATFSWRQHTLRLTQGDKPVALGLDIAMGNFIDGKNTVWEEMFLPSRLQDTLRKAVVPGPDGKDVPLVVEERRVLDAPGREPVPTAPPSWTLPMLGAGAVLGGGLFALGRAAQKVRAARVVYGSLLAVLGLVFGFLGSLFVMFWTLTDHRVAWRNENILTCLPILLVLAGTGINVARGKAASIERAAKITTIVAATSVLGVLLKVLPFSTQDDFRTLALLVPTWIGAALGARHLLGKNPFAKPEPAKAEPEPAKAEG